MSSGRGYYFGARYYDPRTSVWQSADPALSEYLPTRAKKEAEKLPGLGGVFKSSNLGLYGYTHHNPVNLSDPDGRTTTVITILDPDGWDHSAVHVDNPRGKPTLYDPAGTGYNPKDEYGGPARGASQNVFEGDYADLDSYIKENQEAFPNAEIVLQEFNTAPDAEQEIANRMNSLDQKAGAGPGECTMQCKAAVTGAGPFKKGSLFKDGIKPWTIQPESLMEDLSGLKPDKTIRIPPPQAED